MKSIRELIDILESIENSVDEVRGRPVRLRVPLARSPYDDSDTYMDPEDPVDPPDDREIHGNPHSSDYSDVKVTRLNNYVRKIENDNRISYVSKYLTIHASEGQVNGDFNLVSNVQIQTPGTSRYAKTYTYEIGSNNYIDVYDENGQRVFHGPGTIDTAAVKIMTIEAKKFKDALKKMGKQTFDNPYPMFDRNTDNMGAYDQFDEKPEFAKEDTALKNKKRFVEYLFKTKK
jgi:hypothetical protein